MYKFQGDISGKHKMAPWYKLACHCKLQNSTFPKLSVALESKDVYCEPIGWEGHAPCVIHAVEPPIKDTLNKGKTCDLSYGDPLAHAHKTEGNQTNLKTEA